MTRLAFIGKKRRRCARKSEQPPKTTASAQMPHECRI